MTSGQHLCIFTTAHPVDDVRVNSKIAASFLDRGYRVSGLVRLCPTSPLINIRTRGYVTR